MSLDLSLTNELAGYTWPRRMLLPDAHIGDCKGFPLVCSPAFFAVLHFVLFLLSLVVVSDGMRSFGKEDKRRLFWV